jgi:hypothetical protein
LTSHGAAEQDALPAQASVQIGDTPPPRAAEVQALNFHSREFMKSGQS